MGERFNPSGDAALVIAGNLFNLMTAVVIGLVMPMCVSVETYAGYRTYTLYIGYASLFHLGFVNGVALRYGHLDYGRLPYGLFRGFTRALMLSQAGIGLILALALFLGGGGLSPILFVAVNLFATNLRHYYTTVDRFSGRFRTDATALILYDVLLLAGFTFQMVRGPSNAQPILTFITCLNLGMVLCLAVLNREITFGRPATESMDELPENVRRGCFVMLGEIIGGLVLGIDSIFVQLFYDVRHFSAYTFAVYVITAACTALSACDSLIFPTLKRQAPEQLGESYRKLLRRVFLGSTLMLLPVTACIPFISRVLPAYTGSRSILIILCPALVFRMLSGLACRNVLLAMDRERVFMRNNAVALLLGFILDLAVVLFRGGMHMIAAVSVVTFSVWFMLNDRAIRNGLRKGPEEKGSGAG
ncbi:MAG: hypothetical protein IJ088_07000 [Clostridia bacterium]|nr:hypothetical protein [Clostridia bacterium]